MCWVTRQRRVVLEVPRSSFSTASQWTEQNRLHWLPRLNSGTLFSIKGHREAAAEYRLHHKTEGRICFCANESSGGTSAGSQREGALESTREKDS